MILHLKHWVMAVKELRSRKAENEVYSVVLSGGLPDQLNVHLIF